MGEFNDRFTDAEIRIAGLKHNLEQEYYGRELVIAETEHVYGLGAPVRAYIERMNLTEEIGKAIEQSQLGITIWDVGAGTGEGTCGLAEVYEGQNIKFLAVNPHILPRPFDAPMTVPFEVGVIEELADKVGPKAMQSNLYPPDILIASNVLHYCAAFDTLDLALANMHKVLKPGGKALVYSDYPDFCPYLEELIREVNIPFSAKMNPSVRKPTNYLRLTKI